MEIGSILVPFDFSEPSYRALELAKVVADSLGASLEVLHVVPDPYLTNLHRAASPEATDEIPSAEVMADRLADAERALQRIVDPVLGLAAWNTVRIGEPRSVIVDHAEHEGIGLIVMGRHGRGATPRLVLGSVAEKVVRTAACPVVTVP